MTTACCFLCIFSGTVAQRKLVSRAPAAYDYDMGSDVSVSKSKCSAITAI